MLPIWLHALLKDQDDQNIDMASVRPSLSRLDSGCPCLEDMSQKE
jgi:hypothetical protein